MTSISIDIKDGLSSSTAIKGPCRVTTTANIALIGEQTIDGVAVVTGDRVLVKDHTTASDNGIWICDTGNWRRSKDFNKTKDVVKGTQILITSGTLYASSGWYLSSQDPITIGSTNLVFTQNILLNAAQLIALEAAAEAAANAEAAAESAAETAQGGAEDARDEALAAALAANGTVPVANRTALKALSTPTKKTAIIYAEGGRNGTFAFTSGDLSAFVTSDPLEGIYVAPASAPTGSSGAWVRLAGWHVQGADARWWGAANDYNPTTKVGTSIHTAVNAAFSVVSWVVLPAGNMLLADKITMDATGNVGRKLTGAGRRVSTIYANNAFNLAATAMFNMPGPAGGVGFHSIGYFTVICQDQPDDPNIANYINYPPVISCVNQPRVSIDNIRIQEAWIGIDATQDCGGSIFDDIEMSAYSKGIKLDGSTDSVKISRFHWWPFGFPAVTNKRAVFATARGLETFRCDDLHLSDGLMFGSVQAMYAGTSAGGSTFGNITNVDFDDRGGLVMDGANLSVSGCFFSLGKTDSLLVTTIAASTRLQMTGCHLLVAAQSAIGKAIDFIGGVVTMTGCTINGSTIDDNIIRIANSASVTLTGNTFLRNDGIAFTKGIIVAGGSPTVNLTLVGNQARPLLTGTSVFADIGAGVNGVVAANDTPFAGGFGWSYLQRVAGLPNLIIANNTGKNGNSSETISILAADRTGADVSTVQNVFASTEDEITLDAGTTYEFEAQYMISRAAGTTSHTFATLFGGTATFNSIDYVAEIANPTGNVLSNLQALHATAATATVLTAANTSATEYIIAKLRGTMRINAGGTVIPQFQYSAATGGAPTIKRNSFFKVRAMGTNGMVSQGTWS